MTLQSGLFLLILVTALALFIQGRVRVDLVAMLLVLALALSGILGLEAALAGFGSEPAIIVAAAFVISGGLSATGVTDRIGQAIGRAAGASEWRAVAVVMPAVAALAAFSHHLMVTAMMLPILLRLARDQGLPASRLLMPMALAASLGTTLTLFSAPAFLLARDLLERSGTGSLGIFSITPIGALLVLLGMAYMLVARWLLPKRAGGTPEGEYLRLDRYYTELVVEQESPWIGRSIAEFEARFVERLQVVDWLRDGARQPRRGDDERLHAGDVLLVRASPDEIASIAGEPGLDLHAVAKYGDDEDEPGERPAARRARSRAADVDKQLVQAVVAPNSVFIGRTVGDIDFLRTLGVIVVGMWRKEGFLGDEVAQVRLREGDLLVLWGRQRTFADLAAHRGFLMMVPFVARRRDRQRAPVALGIVAAVILASASGALPVQLAFLAGAVAMVLGRCVSIEQAYREIDVRIYVMIAGVIPLGAAMQQTGTAELLARQLLQVAAEWSPFAVLLLVFAAASLLTQVLSDAATVVLLAPVAISLAQALGLPPEPLVVCTALGAVASFLVPIGHHGNLLILNPGQYTFGDFIRVGAPLTVLIGVSSAWLARYLWLGGPLWPDGAVLRALFAT
ncbi:MAG: SLC13 family permease [Steroidobacteraceae bacterium]|jgi:di/tricarboxylate transporter|nr:SLC13 family permease [Steroidobacteraceae bacterium]